MRQPHALPPELRQQPFSTADATAVGVARSRLRRSDLVTPFRGTRAPAATFDAGLLARCRTYATRMPPWHCFSHTTAAALLGMSLPVGGPDPPVLHVANLRGRAPRGPGIAGHTLVLDPEELVLADGLRVPPAPEVWCQLAARASITELVIVGDSLLRRRAPLSTRSELSDAVARSPGRRGAVRLRAALPLLRERTDSPMESALRLAIVAAGLPEPIPNLPIDTSAGTLHGDLVYPAARVIVEYDGVQHRTDARQYHVDIDRLWHLESAGWTVLRIDRTHTADNFAEAVARVRAALRARGRDSPPPAW
ncbi:DUF559 domain-containing protein [uncultured Leifsonia sp.]|uniref:DUF559 domain-containing protein n=1 Tax=uncultured Leifsonia sp. TaxID=340359 RepID=UPI0028D39054|nr:DUF559 domain-containing protein [uncultured Leifsonia sp.]